MADKTEKKEKYKDLSNGEKYLQLKEIAKNAGLFLIGGVIGAGAVYAAYKIGKSAGAYDTIEEIYTNFPEARDALIKIDPAFFTTIK